MHNKSEIENSGSSARRRLLRGGFAVPAVLTVASGSAFARTSSGCIAREAAQGETPAFSTDSSTAAGTYVRVAALTYKPSGATKVRSWWVSYASLNAVATAAGVTIKNGWIASTQTLCVESGSGAPSSADYVAGTLYTTTALPTLNTAATDGQTARYYAVLFNSSGDVIGVSGKYTATGQTGGAVNSSCWTSFKPV